MALLFKIRRLGSLTFLVFLGNLSDSLTFNLLKEGGSSHLIVFKGFRGCKVSTLQAAPLRAIARIPSSAA